MAELPNDTSRTILTAREQYKTQLAQATAPLQFNQSQIAFSQGGVGTNLAAGIANRQAVKTEQERFRRDVVSAKDVFEVSVAKGAPEYGEPEYVDKEYAAVISRVQKEVDRLNKRIDEVKTRANDSSLSPEALKSLLNQRDVLEAERDAYAQGLSMGKIEAIKAGQGDYFDQLASAKSSYELAVQLEKARQERENKTYRDEANTKQKVIESKFPGITEKTPESMNALFNNTFTDYLNKSIDKAQKIGSLTAELYNQKLRETENYIQGYAKERGYNISFPSIPTGTTTYQGEQKITTIGIPATKTSVMSSNVYDKSGQLVATKIDYGPSFKQYSTGAIEYLDLGSSKLTPTSIVNTPIVGNYYNPGQIPSGPTTSMTYNKTTGTWNEPQIYNTSFDITKTSGTYTMPSMIPSAYNQEKIRTETMVPINQVTSSLSPSAVKTSQVTKEDVLKNLYTAVGTFSGQGKSTPTSTYDGVPYSASKTMAVEVGTGRIAKDYGLNTRNANLEDHYFIQSSNGNYIDMGVMKPELKGQTYIPTNKFVSENKFAGGKGTVGLIGPLVKYIDTSGKVPADLIDPLKIYDSYVPMREESNNAFRNLFGMKELPLTSPPYERNKIVLPTDNVIELPMKEESNNAFRKLFGIRELPLTGEPYDREKNRVTLPTDNIINLPGREESNAAFKDLFNNFNEGNIKKVYNETPTAVKEGVKNAVMNLPGVKLIGGAIAASRLAGANFDYQKSKDWLSKNVDVNVKVSDTSTTYTLPATQPPVSPYGPITITLDKSGNQVIESAPTSTTTKTYNAKTGTWSQEKPYTITSSIDVKPTVYTLPDNSIMSITKESYKPATLREHIGILATLAPNPITIIPQTLWLADLPPNLQPTSKLDIVNPFYLTNVHRELKAQEEMQKQLKGITPPLKIVTDKLKNIANVLKPFNENQEVLNKEIKDAQTKYNEGKISREQLMALQEDYEIASSLNLAKYTEYKPEIEKLQQEQEKLITTPAYIKALNLQESGTSMAKEYSKTASGFKEGAVSFMMAGGELATYFIPPLRILKGTELGLSGIEHLQKKEYLSGGFDVGMSALILGAPLLWKGANTAKPASPLWSLTTKVAGVGLVGYISTETGKMYYTKTGSVAAGVGAGLGALTGLVGPPLWQSQISKTIVRREVKEPSNALEGTKYEGLVTSAPSGKKHFGGKITFIEQTPKGVPTGQETTISPEAKNIKPLSAQELIDSVSKKPSTNVISDYGITKGKVSLQPYKRMYKGKPATPETLKMLDFLQDQPPSKTLSTPTSKEIITSDKVYNPLKYSSSFDRGSEYPLGTSTVSIKLTPGVKVSQFWKWQDTLESISKHFGFQLKPTPKGFGKSGTTNVALFEPLTAQDLIQQTIKEQAAGKGFTGATGKYTSGLYIPRTTIFKFADYEIKTPEIRLLRTTIMNKAEGLRSYQVGVQSLMKQGYTLSQATKLLQEKIPKASLIFVGTPYGGGKEQERYMGETSVATQIPGMKEGIKQMKAKGFTTDRGVIWKTKQYEVDISVPISGGGYTKGATFKKEGVPDLLEAFISKPQSILRGENEFLTGDVSSKTGMLKTAKRLGDVISQVTEVPTKTIDFNTMQQLRKLDPAIDSKLSSGIGVPKIWKEVVGTENPATHEVKNIRNNYNVIVLDKQVLRAKRYVQNMGTKTGGEEYQSYIYTKEIGPDGKIKPKIVTLAGPELKVGTSNEMLRTERLLEGFPHLEYTDFNRQLIVSVKATPSGGFGKVISISQHPVKQVYPPWEKYEQVKYGFPSEGTAQQYIKKLSIRYIIPSKDASMSATESPMMLLEGRQPNLTGGTPLVRDKPPITIDNITLKKFIKTTDPMVLIKDIDEATRGMEKVNLVTGGKAEVFDVIRKEVPQKPLGRVVGDTRSLSGYKYTTQEDIGEVLKFVSQTDGRTIYPRNLVDMRVIKVPSTNPSQVTLVAKSKLINRETLNTIRNIIDTETKIVKTDVASRIGLFFNKQARVSINPLSSFRTRTSESNIDVSSDLSNLYTDLNLKNTPKKKFTYDTGGGSSRLKPDEGPPLREAPEPLKFEFKPDAFALAPAVVPTIFPYIETGKITNIPVQSSSLDLSNVFVPIPASSVPASIPTSVPTTVPTSVQIYTTVPVQVPVMTPTTVPTTTTIPVPTTTSVPITTPVPITETVPVTTQVPVQVPVVVPVAVPVTVPVPTPAYIPGYEPPKPLIGGLFLPPLFTKKKPETPKKKLKAKVGYEVEIRRRKKFKSLTPFAFRTKEEAIQFGAKTTLETAAATFRVKQSVKPIKENLPIPRINIKQFFRAPKRKEAPETYIQKSNVRIKSYGEKSEISYAGVAARTGKPNKIKPTSFLKSKSQSKSKRNKFF